MHSLIGKELIKACEASRDGIRCRTLLQAAQQEFSKEGRKGAVTKGYCCGEGRKLDLGFYFPK